MMLKSQKSLCDDCIRDCLWRVPSIGIDPPVMNCHQFVAKPVTNYDRLISKTPEELAGWISAYSENCDDCRYIRSGDPYVNGGCYSCWLDWLKSPVEVSE